MKFKETTPESQKSTVEKKADINLDEIKTWDESEDGKVCIKKIEAVPTALWRNGWYKSPSSGRSINYGIATENPKEHQTVIIKGGSFFVEDIFKKGFEEKKLSLDELYGGLSGTMAQKEYDIAKLIQEKFKLILHKKANCPEPIDVKVVGGILNEENSSMELIDFFEAAARKEPAELKFTQHNFLQTAAKQGIDIFYPMSEEADIEVKKNPFRWMYNQCLEKTNQSVYRYKIDGPNTRLLDLMTQDLSDREKYFIEANNATDLRNAVKIFSSKLGEFYGVLHKNNISYHAGFSEHCTLIDVTVSGVIMDIGGLSEDNTIGSDSEAYIVQILKTTNLLAYLCKNILKTEDDVSKSALSTFWDSYRNIYFDGNIKHLSERITDFDTPDKIRSRYLDNTSGDWIKLAPDLEGLLYPENKEDKL